MSEQANIDKLLKEIPFSCRQWKPSEITHWEFYNEMGNRMPKAGPIAIFFSKEEADAYALGLFHSFIITGDRRLKPWATVEK